MRKKQLMQDVRFQTCGLRGNCMMLMLRQVNAEQQTAPPCGQKEKKQKERKREMN